MTPTPGLRPTLKTSRRELLRRSHTFMEAAAQLAHELEQSKERDAALLDALDGVHCADSDSDHEPAECFMCAFERWRDRR